jgi:cleavage stimulation factor subunit 2
MLLQNPQLAYALLQAQVVMHIVNPETALRMLHPKTNTAKPLIPPPAAAPVAEVRSVPQYSAQQSYQQSSYQPPQHQPEVRPPTQRPVHTDPRASRQGPPQAAAGGSTTQDQEKLQLIHQVLQLTPEQINMLPPDQRKSILALKDQIKKGKN